MIFFGFFISRTICHLIGFLYPAYKSFKALESHDEQDDKQYLTYWTVFASLVVFEYYLEFIINWLPFYYEVKILLLLWLIFPVQSSVGGASFLYNVYIEPFLRSREKVIDQMISDAGLSFLIPEQNPVIVEEIEQKLTEKQE